jgi:hypothetical protein
MCGLPSRRCRTLAKDETALHVHAHVCELDGDHLRADRAPPCALAPLDADSATARAAEDACGDAVMLQTFDQYPGPPANYTADMLAADFPRGKKRDSAAGEALEPGLIRATDFGRAYVGQKAMRIQMPKGACAAARG